MSRRQLVIALFAATVALQLAVPLAMVVRQERTLATGPVYKFQLRPVDPVDPLRGRYLAIELAAETVPRPPDLALVPGLPVFAALTNDAAGFAWVSRLSVEAPAEPYLACRVAYAAEMQVGLAFPFDRYYLNERDAVAADAELRNLVRERPEAIWVTVRLRRGQGVIEGLFVGGDPLAEFLRLHRPGR